MTTKHTTAEAERDTSRLEAFSDGVFAVAITLLVLNLHTPVAADLRAHRGLLHALLDQWPTYVAYALSFISILIFWVNHHNIFKCIRHVDRLFLLLNGLLLMTITIIPFSTDVIAQYIRGSEQRVAEVLYSGTFLVAAVIFNRLWAYAAREGRLLGTDVDQGLVKSISAQYRFGPLLYLATFILAFVNAWASFALIIALAIFYALPNTVSRSLERL
jgi:uncharacterized membrane protein